MYRKRERTQNWSVEEKKYLLELVKSRLDVLENKRIDSASSAMKGMAWQDIHAAFAARFGNDRDAHRVREQWRRMKGQSRTEMMEFAERVRNYGAEVATNQRWPSALSEDVWKTLEAARKLNEFQQGYGGGEDVNSPVTMMDDDEDDGDDGYDPDRSGAGVADRMSENGIKLEPDGDRYDGNHHLRDHGRDYDADVRIMGHTVGHGMGEDGGHGLMNMLRPKVELNDVPDVDTSMVPAGLSITTVKLGSGGQKRRMVDRQQHQQQQQQQQQQPHDLASRTNPWDSPGQAGGSAPRDLRELRELRDVRDLHALALLGPGHGGHGGHGNAARPSRSATPQQHHAVNGHPPTTVQESKRLELRRRLEMMEEEHDAKMALLRVEKETAEVRRRIALQEEADAASALTCRSCGGERTSTGAVRPVRGEQRARRARRASGAGGGADADADADAPHALPLSDALRGGGSGGSGSSSGTGPSSPASPADSRGASEHGGVVNGLKHEDDSSQE